MKVEDMVAHFFQIIFACSLVCVLKILIQVKCNKHFSKTKKIKEKQVCLRRIFKNQNLFPFFFEAVFKIAFNILSQKVESRNFGHRIVLK